MSEPSIRDALLQQNGGTSFESELKMLNGLVEAESRRVRRLTFWAIGVWVLWFFVIATLCGGSLLAFDPVPEIPAAEKLEAPQVKEPPSRTAKFLAATSLFAVTVLLCGFVVLTVVGVVLLILLMVSRRSATVTQLRIGVTSIEAQLRLLAAAQKTPPKASQD
jgi:hypothetical protein